MKNKSLLKYFGAAVIVLIITAVVGKKLEWFGKGTILEVAVEKASKRKIIEFISASGKIQPQTEVKISPEVSGEIVELLVKEGDAVKTGDLLLKINPEIYLSTLDRIEAALNSSKSNLANSKSRFTQVQSQFKQAELSYKRQKKLWDEKAISQAEFENATSSYEVAKAEVDASEQTVRSAEFNVKSAEASLKEAKENLTKTSLYAPIDGTISKLNVEKGERVVGTMQFAGTELLRIANLNQMEVTVDVNENDIVKLTLYDTATIEVDAYLGKKFKGLVCEIANSATTSGVLTDQVTNFNVKILILADSYKDLIPKDKPNYYPFRPGMSATVDIQTNVKDNVLSVPIQAVTTRLDSTKLAMKNDGKKKTKLKSDEFGNEEVATENTKIEDLKEVVFVYRENMVYQVEVKTGIQDNNFIEIISGLKENEQIVTAPYASISKKLKDKQKVKKVDKEELFKEKN